MVLICGIDEAGRGPVLGPMVMGGVVIDESDVQKLIELGVKDSKLLTHEQRESMFEEIKKIVKAFEIISVSAEEVDFAVFSQSSSLNELEAQTTVKILQKLNPQKAIVDCPSINASAYKQNLEKHLSGIEIIAEHKADLNYPVVSAASILAKVTRDREIEELKKKICVDFGSGYPSDPLTKEFLANNWEKYNGLFRKSWSSWQAFKEKKIQKGLWDF